jgi:hypothetical protein
MKVLLFEWGKEVLKFYFPLANDFNLLMIFIVNYLDGIG